LKSKRSVNPPTEITGAFSVLDKGSVKRGKGAVLCMRPELSAVNSDNFYCTDMDDLIQNRTF
jgi:hypothetical protein